MRNGVAGLTIIPVALLVHNLEEAFTIAAARPRLEALWSTLLGCPVALPSVHESHLALAVVTGLAFGVLVLARFWEPASYALVVLQAVMTVNVLTHVVGALLLRGYAPGVVTALLVEAPTSAFVFRRVRAAGWMSPGRSEP